METYESGALPYTYWTVDHHHTAQLTEGGIIEESLVSIYVNGQELATVMCSPIDQEALAVGFLYNEGVIDSIDEIRLIKPNIPRSGIDIFLNRSDFDPPRRMILTSGCGGGISLQDLTATHPPLDTPLTIKPDIIFERMHDLQGEARLYNSVRGVHTSVLADTEGILASAEDVGRHNTIDKIAGKALQSGINTQDGILLSSGRISSEMLNKARRMGVPIVASRTAPTSISINLAQTWNICVIGYVRRGSMRVYTHPHRLGISEIQPVK